MKRSMSDASSPTLAATLNTPTQSSPPTPFPSPPSTSQGQLIDISTLDAIDNSAASSEPPHLPSESSTSSRYSISDLLPNLNSLNFSLDLDLTPDNLKHDNSANTTNTISVSTPIPGTRKYTNRLRDFSAYLYQPLSELVSRLVYVVVTDADSRFVDAFLLTYRRFATPRMVLLQLQRRLKDLNEFPEEDTYTTFAKLRLCYFLERWTMLYPDDFYTRGAPGALRGLQNTILDTPELIYYVSDLIPFIEKTGRTKSRDDEKDWAMAIPDLEGSDSEGESLLRDGVADGDGELDGSTTIIEVDEDVDGGNVDDVVLIDHDGRARAGSADSLKAPSPSSIPSTVPITPSSGAGYKPKTPSTSPLPSHRKLSNPSPLPVPSNGHQSSLDESWWGMSVKVRSSRSSSNASQQVLRHLQDVAIKILHARHEDIANEITKIQLELFLKIEPRDWIRHIMIKPSHDHEPESLKGEAVNGTHPTSKVKSKKKRKRKDPIRDFTAFYNQLGSWITSIILAADSIRTRVRMLAKCVDIAQSLRSLHNYSGLRAVTAGIMNATYDGDKMMEMFQEATRDKWKTLSSYDVLLSSAKGHSAYRMAIGGLESICIPETEIHTSDLRRLNTINPDFHRTESEKIHWGKFAAMGKIVGELTVYQNRCRRSIEERGGKLRFEEYSHIRKWLCDGDVMDEELVQARIPPPEAFDSHGHGNGNGNGYGLAGSPPGGFKRLANIFSS